MISQSMALGSARLHFCDVSARWRVRLSPQGHHNIR